jgi:hypothetical protein
MAKAIIAKKDWEEAFGKGSSSPSHLAEVIREIMTHALQEREMQREVLKDDSL